MKFVLFFVWFTPAILSIWIGCLGFEYFEGRIFSAASVITSLLVFIVFFAAAIGAAPWGK